LPVSIGRLPAWA